MNKQNDSKINQQVSYRINLNDLESNDALESSHSLVNSNSPPMVISKLESIKKQPMRKLKIHFD